MSLRQRSQVHSTPPNNIGLAYRIFTITRHDFSLSEFTQQLTVF